MRVILVLLALRLAAVRKIVKDREGAKIAVMGAFALIFALVSVGMYQILLWVFGAITRELGAAGPALTLYILETSLVLVWLLALMSYLVSGLWIFFHASDTSLLLSTPLSLTTLYWLRVTETFTLTLWAFVVLGVPALLALGASYGSDARYYLHALGVLVLFVAFTGGTGAIGTTLAGVAFRRFRIRTATLVLSLVLLGGFALLIGRDLIPSRGDFEAIFQPGILNGKPGSIKFIEAKFGLWPSHPFAVTFYTSATGQAAGTATSRAALWLGPLLVLTTALFPGRWLYRRTLPLAAEGFVLAGGGENAPPTRQRQFPRLFSGPVGSLLERDLLRLGRSPRELGHAGFLLFLLALYTAFLFAAPLREVGANPEAVAWLSLLNVAAAGYFLTAFGLRFVFPSLSLEGRAAWVLFASPVRIFRLFIAKLVLYAVLLFLVVGGIALAGTLRLSPPPSLFVALAILLVLVTATTVAVSLAFGTTWPNFTQSKPESLATSAGGLATTFVCLGYVALAGWLAQRMTLAVLNGQSPWGPLLVGLGVSSVIVASVVAAARRKIQRLEVV
ncbi:MAG: hypothetical protein ACE5FK_02300 [Candidatus Methylomirabilia bacterium]